MSESLLPVAILAGGMATRLGPLTRKMPKALMDLNGEPFIAHQLRLLANRGVEHVVVCAWYLGEMIRDVVGDGTRYGVEVRFAFDGPRPLGTAGALLAAADWLGEAFFVLYGDSYLPVSFTAVQGAFEGEGRLGLMTVYRNDGRFDRSNVEFDGQTILAYDKVAQSPGMRHIDYGLGVLSRGALGRVPPGVAYDLADLYRDLLADGELGACEVHERFYEIGSLDGLEETRRYLASQTQLKGVA